MTIYLSVQMVGVSWKASVIITHFQHSMLLSAWAWAWEGMFIHGFRTRSNTAKAQNAVLNGNNNKQKGRKKIKCFVSNLGIIFLFVEIRNELCCLGVRLLQYKQWHRRKQLIIRIVLSDRGIVIIIAKVNGKDK